MADSKHRIADHTASHLHDAWIKQGFGDAKSFKAEILSVAGWKFIGNCWNGRYYFLVVWSLGDLETCRLEILNKLFDHVVVPRLCYLWEVFLFHPSRLIVILHNFFASDQISWREIYVIFLLQKGCIIALLKNCVIHIL